MAIFRVPRITSVQRAALLLDVGEIVYDIDQNTFYGGNGVTSGGFLIGQSSGSIVDILTLTQTNIDDKQATLSQTPLIPSSVILTPEGGISQIYGVDYIVTGNLLDWTGLGLDGFLEAGDKIVVQY
jgi:hypothetical protein